MDHCTVETGLLRKSACGKNAVTHCANCEQALCAEHAVPQLNEAGKKSGKFMCKECHEAKREFDKTMAKQAKEKDITGSLKKPAAPAHAAPAAPAAAKPAPAAAKPAEKKDEGGIDFTPTKK
jgi:hypothetical protein